MRRPLFWVTLNIQNLLISSSMERVKQVITTQFYITNKSLLSIRLYGVPSSLNRAVTRMRVPIKNHVGPNNQSARGIAR